jgi:quercetin dioxygenase-like cupin family protein
VKIFDLGAEGGRGPIWGLESDDLNATLLAWPAGEATPAHVNAERDVLLVVLDGSGVVTVEGRESRLRADQACVLRKGRRRSVEAGPDGIRYLSVHRRRGGLQISPPER